MNSKEFRRNAHKVADWMADFMEGIEKYPVKSTCAPGEVLSALPVHPPAEGEAFDVLMDDVERTILPGITHWQSPNFFAYFPANTSGPSILAEMITATLGAQCMMWETSPAAAELEERMMEWLKEMTGLPAGFSGVIQDSASTATLVALISARERITEFQTNEIGFLTNRYRVYCSSEAHSSVEKAVKIAGLGKQSLVKVDVDQSLRMIPEKLEESLAEDIKAGLIPCCVVAALGTTGTCSFDPLHEIAAICKRFHVWLHVDAAYAGSAFVLPAFRHYLKGIEKADSYVFNPHKWMFTNFDCSAYFVKNKGSLIRSFEILPEYLKTRNDRKVNNYRDWGIQLGRRFRALKLWFVIRSMGAEGIRKKISDHIHWAANLAEIIRKEPGFELFEPQNMGLVCFRIVADGKTDEAIDLMNQQLLNQLNDSGSVYLSHTKIHQRYFLRMSIGQTEVQEKHVEQAWNTIKAFADEIRNL
jgi:aromatic-L-amino-acid decarboxylase